MAIVMQKLLTLRFYPQTHQCAFNLCNLQMGRFGVIEMKRQRFNWSGVRLWGKSNRYSKFIWNRERRHS